MMQVMCSKGTDRVCDGSCDDPGCMAKHPPQVAINCGNCERLARENAELRDREAALWSSVDNAQLRAFIEKHGVPHPLVQRAERAESELAALRKRVGDAPVAAFTWIDGTEWRLDDSTGGVTALSGKRVRLVEESV